MAAADRKEHAAGLLHACLCTQQLGASKHCISIPDLEGRLRCEIWVDHVCAVAWARLVVVGVRDAFSRLSSVSLMLASLQFRHRLNLSKRSIERRNRPGTWLESCISSLSRMQPGGLVRLAKTNEVRANGAVVT